MKLIDFEEDKVMNNLFLVHTPFQLMNCLNIIENYYSDSTNEIAFLHKNVDSFSFLVKKYNENIKMSWFTLQWCRIHNIIVALVGLYAI